MVSNTLFYIINTLMLQTLSTTDDSKCGECDKMIKPGLFVHLNCRNAIYPKSKIERFQVPESLVFWSEKYPDYKPPFYESSTLKGKPWADEPKEKIGESVHSKWNKVDGPINRLSFTGNYDVVDKLPRNPFGRTGIIGRGLLGRWGPNHAVDPIVTRWKREENGRIIQDPYSGRSILEMVAIQRKDNDMWAIPGGMVDAGEQINVALKREFIEETMHNNQELKHIVERFFDKVGAEIYSGYVDDPRNTDNAWMETTAYNFHDETGKELQAICFQAGDDAGEVKWLDISNNMKLYANHKDIIKLVADKFKAHWYWIGSVS